MTLSATVTTGSKTNYIFYQSPQNLNHLEKEKKLVFLHIFLHFIQLFWKQILFPDVNFPCPSNITNLHKLIYAVTDS